MARKFYPSQQVIYTRAVSTSLRCVSVWTYSFSLSGSAQRWVTGGSDGIAIRHDGAGTVLFYCKPGSAGGQVSVAGVVATNIWQHWFGIFDDTGPNSKLYLNGNLIGTGNFISGSDSGNASFQLNASSSEYADVALADAAMWFGFPGITPDKMALLLYSGMRPNQLRPDLLYAYDPCEDVNRCYPYAGGSVVTGFQPSSYSYIIDGPSQLRRINLGLLRSLRYALQAGAVPPAPSVLFLRKKFRQIRAADSIARIN